MTNLQERGILFVEPTTEVYEGMIVGENSRADDMDVNITKEKQQTNIRSATSDNFEKLVPPRRLSLEQCLEFCREDECVEVTPQNVRIRKLVLDQNERAKIASRARKGQRESAQSPRQDARVGANAPVRSCRVGVDVATAPTRRQRRDCADSASQRGDLRRLANCYGSASTLNDPIVPRLLTRGCGGGHSPTQPRVEALSHPPGGTR